MPRHDLPPNPVTGLQIGSVNPRTVFLNQRVETLYRWWQGHADRRGGLPLWADFDITDHGALAACLFVVETPPDGTFRFRILGEQVITMIGRNVAGDLVRSRPSDDYGHELYDYYREIVAERECRMCRGTLDFAGAKNRKFESIDCPVTDDAGTITRIIGVMDYIS